MSEKFPRLLNLLADSSPKVMQNLGRLSQMMNTVSTVAAHAQKNATYQFTMKPNSTLYFHAAHATVEVHRHTSTLMEIRAKLQIPMGWRIQSEEDDAGVYFVAGKRSLVGLASSATFTILAPQDAHLILRVDATSIALKNVSGVYEIPPQGTSETIKVVSSTAEKSS